MFDLGSVVAHIKADLTGFKEGVEQAQKQAKNLGDSFQGIGQNIQQVANQAALFTGAVAVGLVAFGKKSVDAYNDAQLAEAQLEHAVIGVTHATREQLEATSELADELEKKGVLDGDNIKTGLAQLSTFGLSNKAVQGLAGSMADLSVNQFGVNASGDQVAQSANMIAKALNGQFGVLEKSGIRFSDAQIKMIKFGTEMEKVKAINEGFAQNLKLTNEVAKDTASGSIARLNVAFENFQETIGEFLSTALTPLLNGLADILNSEQVEQTIYHVVGAFQALYDILIKGEFPAFFQNFFHIAEDSPLSVMLLQLHAALVVMGTWISENRELVITFLEGLGVALGALLVIGTVTIAIAALTNPLVLLSLAIAALFTAWQTNFLGIRDVTQQFMDWINTVFVPAFNVFTGFFKDRWDFISLIVKGAWEVIGGIIKLSWDIISGFLTIGLQIMTGDWSGAWETLKTMTSKVWDDLKGIFNGALDFIKGWAGSIFHGLVQPFEDAWNKIKEISEKIKGQADPNQRHSPSLVDRVQKGVRDLNDAWGNLDFGMGSATTSMRATSGIGLAPAGAGAGMGGNVIHIDMSGAYIGNEQAADEMAQRMGDQIIRRLQATIKF